jgi:hypothetical protein
MYLGLSPAIIAQQEFEGDRHYQLAANPPGFFGRLVSWFKRVFRL